MAEPTDRQRAPSTWDQRERFERAPLQVGSAAERRRLFDSLVEALSVDPTSQTVAGLSDNAAFDGLLDAMPSKNSDVLHVERAVIGGMVETGERVTLRAPNVNRIWDVPAFAIVPT